MQPLDDITAFGPDLVRKRHQPGQSSVDGDVDAGMALLVKRRPIRFRGPDIDVALPHETFVADMQVIAVNLAFDAKADSVLGFLAIGNVSADLAGLDAQRFGDRVLELGFRRRRQASRCRSVMPRCN